MYAIIEDSGTQIRVRPGEILEIDLRPEEVAEGASVTFDRVLLVGDEKKPAVVGTPYVDGASVTAEVLGEIKGPKIDVIKFKRRKGYRRKAGHRQRVLRVRIDTIKS
ncbi:MAG: 50S ribosomal protein L21 [Planctomycetota bacterium]